MSNRLQWALAIALLPLAAASIHADQSAVFACTLADGRIVLSSISNGDRCEQIATPARDEASAAAKPAAPAASAPEAASAAASAVAEMPTMNARLASYRDSMVRGANKDPDAPAPATNPAASRRYLMLNRSAYQAAP